MASRTVNSSSPMWFTKSGAACAKAFSAEPARKAAPPNSAASFRNSRRCRRPLFSFFIFFSSEARFQVREASPDFFLGRAQSNVLVIHVGADGELLLAQQRQHGTNGRV